MSPGDFFTQLRKGGLIGDSASQDGDPTPVIIIYRYYCQSSLKSTELEFLLFSLMKLITNTREKVTVGRALDSKCLLGTEKGP